MKYIIGWIRQPWVINAVQILQYCVGIFAGVKTVQGTANPQFIQTTIGQTLMGQLLIITVGCMLILGCTFGAYAVVKGYWWLERISLIIVGLAFFALWPPAFYYSWSRPNPSIWIVLVLVVWAVGDCIKRYRRIDWAYLDPSK